MKSQTGQNHDLSASIISDTGLIQILLVFDFLQAVFIIICVGQIVRHFLIITNDKELKKKL